MTQKSTKNLIKMQNNSPNHKKKNTKQKKRREHVFNIPLGRIGDATVDGNGEGGE